MRHAKLSPFVSQGQVIVCDKCTMLNRRYSSAVLLQIMPHERDVAANFVRKNALSVPGKKKICYETVGDFRNTDLVLNEIGLFGTSKGNKSH